MQKNLVGGYRPLGSDEKNRCGKVGYTEMDFAFHYRDDPASRIGIDGKNRFAFSDHGHGARFYSTPAVTGQNFTQGKRRFFGIFADHLAVPVNGHAVSGNQSGCVRVKCKSRARQNRKRRHDHQ
ncbi:MAG: hypothetical protein C4548_11885 [Desulfobacteraceae bacterium]|nr:MAG: hypothetical protein C4548_11885 [Desulfobacteraceae bacterium]